MQNQRFKLKSLLTIIALLSAHLVFSQARTYSFSKGEVLDLLFLSNQPNNDSTRSYYFKNAFPIAKRYGFKLHTAMSVARPALLGNYQPEILVPGSWPNLDSRLRASHELESKVADFHQLRREIWSSFNMNYWVLKDSLTFTIDPTKYNVITAYWKQDQDASFQQEMQRLSDVRDSAGATSILTLYDAKSPFMYDYAPTYLTLTAWPNKAAYQAFQKQTGTLKQEIIKQVHEFNIK